MSLSHALPEAHALPEERRGRAIAYRLAAATGFAVMAALIKVAVEDGVAVVEIMFWRFAFGLPAALAAVIVLGASKARAVLLRRRTRRVIDAVSGAFLVGFAAKLAREG